MNQEKKKNKVLLGMSGGIDSSVAAVLLKKKGFEVTGAFMDLREDNELSEKPKNKAKEIANLINIPFCIFNLQQEFKKKIINEFIQEYRIGNTPNPCVNCNKEIKFGVFYEKALTMGFDYVATGHYVKKMQNAKCKNQNNKSKSDHSPFSMGCGEILNYRLLKGKDEKKDQSYFLWRLNHKDLEKIIFPLGNYTKKEVKERAKKYNLCFDEKYKESQEVCFIEKTTTDFLKDKLGEQKGDIVNINGKKIGCHSGLWFYTIGQRKGMNLPGGPYFVVDKKIEENVLIVSNKKEDLLKKEFKINKVNWINEGFSENLSEIKVKIRYGHNPVFAKISNISEDEYKIFLRKPQKSITPGQSAVFYRNNELLGGGIIMNENKS